MIYINQYIFLKMQENFQKLNELVSYTNSLSSLVAEDFKQLIEKSMIVIAKQEYSNQELIDEQQLKLKSEQLISSIKQLQSIGGIIDVLNSAMAE
ncbi:hypothetical protein SS50377_23457 [Spironucleus salmonicida]|uniref:Uncharacterized protein n=2 Tax=Spironucleus salmonicida TaxID=348837 RepID=A0A9P8LT07_9EUKA|nr:hypothetical protein SS50377_23457 [Spironucleus salmonicida]